MLSSCLKNNEWESYYEVDKNTQIKTFSLTSDSVSALAKVAFTIDQINGRIMNLDSMEYGTKIDRVICNMTYGSYAKEIKALKRTISDKRKPEVGKPLKEHSVHSFKSADVYKWYSLPFSCAYME